MTTIFQQDLMNFRNSLLISALFSRLLICKVLIDVIDVEHIYFSIQFDSFCLISNVYGLWERGFTQTVN